MMANEWLGKARDGLGAAVPDGAPGYELTQEDVDELLELARIAAHESGERISAPLVCYLVGLARGRNPERSLAELVDAVVSASRSGGDG